MVWKSIVFAVILRSAVGMPSGRILPLFVEFGGKCCGEYGTMDVLWHVSRGDSERYGGKCVAVLWEVIKWFPVLISRGVGACLSSVCK